MNWQQSWEHRGYAVLEGFLDAAELARLNDAIERAWSDRRHADNPLVADVWLDDPGRRARMYFRDVPDEARGRPHKINDLYLVDPAVREIILSPRLDAVLREVMGGDVAVCNSLYLEWGSQQPYHFDTYYMPGPRPNTLVATSICLEDHHPDAGPLRFFPGSHLIPPYVFSHGGRHAVPEEMALAEKHVLDEIARRGLTPIEFHGRRGDVLVWHEQLYHGGSPIVDVQRTRRTLVTHYWRSDGLQLGPESTVQEIDAHRSFIRRPHQTVPSDR